MVTELQLQRAYLTGGVERVSWWNGRVLTAEDMADLQRATDLSDLRLGRAMGPGVARGLLVTRRDRHSVDVAAGLAVDPEGETLELTAPVVVHLVRPPEERPVPGADFGACSDHQLSITSAGTGAYLLTISSADGTRGSALGAPVRGAATSTCGPRYQVAGVQFRLVELDMDGLASAGGHDNTDLDVLATLGTTERHPRLRNVIAHVLLDSVVRARALLDPFGRPASYTSSLGSLAFQGALSDCEVPLAMLTWTDDGIDFVDCWAVRRSPSSAPTVWPSSFAGARAGDTGLECLLQFVSHLGELVGPSGSEASLEAHKLFRYVPSAVLLPLIGARGQRGVDLSVFMTGLDLRGGESMAAGRVWPMMNASLLSPVVDLDGGGVLRSYTVDEAVAAGAGQPYVVLIADHLRHLAITPPDDSDRLVITSVSPPGDHQIGSQITVHGRNFTVPGDRNTVTVGGVRVLQYNPGTNESALVFNVPTVPDAPRVAPIVVSNDRGVAEWLISVTERVVVPEGEIEFVEDFGDLADQTIDEDETFTFSWQVTAVTDVAASYRFRPVFTGAAGVPDADWESRATVVDDGGAERDTFELRPADPADPASGPVRVGVRLTVPVGADSVELSLACEFPPAPNDPDLNRPSSPVAIVVGEAVTPSDPRIVFDAPTISPGGTVADGALIFRVDVPARVRLRARLGEAGSFSYAGQVEPASDIWTLENPNPAPGVEIPEDGGSEHEFGLTLRATADETNPARVLRVRLTGIPAGGGERYVSFVRLRLRTV
ncbi:MAG: hypothetical protein EOP32_00315 [Rhodococcus sp. (in: high G+C Gram-positive bacteria)]|nr:MAG: hypothetical protein EOP32_00315 [Rhodococcus sp. (in: high G+C Gram-positive bacteria)]